MFRLWKQALAHFGRDTTTTECTWCRSREFGETQGRDGDRTAVVKAGAKDGFKVCGTMLTFGGSAVFDSRYRMRQVKKTILRKISISGWSQDVSDEAEAPSGAPPSSLCYVVRGQLELLDEPARVPQWRPERDPPLHRRREQTGP